MRLDPGALGLYDDYAALLELCWPFSLSGVTFWQLGRKSASILTRMD